MDKLDDLIMRESSNKMMKKILYEPEEETFFTMIIAMKGDPYTGKTTCADAIAKAYKCPVISYDDILDSLSPSSPADSQQITELALAVALRVATVQMDLQRPVVIDSPLSDPAHLHLLIKFANACKQFEEDRGECRFVIVECRPEAKYAWQMRFEKRRDPDEFWFKPKEWDDVKESPSIESYNPPEDLPDYFSRLIVDTTGYVDHRNLGPATKDLVSCKKGHLLHFRDWLPEKPIHRSFPILDHDDHDHQTDTNNIVQCGTDGRHFLTQVSSLTDDISCRACQVPIPARDNSPAYACKRCDLTLHQSCAELAEVKRMVPDPLSTLPPLFLSGGPFEELSIPDEHKRSCTSCARFSVDCEQCLWETHLRARFVPTVLRHEGHPGHSLCFWITSRPNKREYQCEACKLPGAFVGYTCLEGTFRFNFHVGCVLLPRPMRHVHGGHQHDMRLLYGTKELQEDYLCDVCGDQRDPTAWFYYCDSCVFSSHLHCIYDSDE